MVFETGSQTQYTPDGQRTYNQNGELVTHHGHFETLADQTAAFTRASVAYREDGSQVAAGVPRYEYARQPAPVWQDTFDTDQLAEYTSGGDTPATWTVSGGILTGTGGAQATLIKNDLLLQDVEIEVNCDQADQGGVIARYQDNNNYYLIRLGDDSSGLTSNITLFKRVAGIFTQLGVVDVTWPQGTSKPIKFTLHGSRILVYFDGVKVINVTDATFTGGGVGLRNSSTVASRYLNFAVYCAQQGVMLEEGTSNLVKTNGGATADFSNATGWTAMGQGQSIANGVATLQSPNGTTVSGFQCTLTNLAQNTRHSFLIRARYKDGTGTAQVLSLDLQAVGYDNLEQELDISPDQLTMTFQNFKKDGFDSQSAPASVALRIFTFSTRPIEVEFVQLEQNKSATTFHDSSRVKDVLTTPTVNMFNKGNWAIELTYIPTGAGGEDIVSLWGLACADAGNWYRILIYNNGRFQCSVTASGAEKQCGGSSGISLSQGQPYKICFTGDGSYIRLFVNGVQLGSAVAYTEPSSALNTNMYIGADYQGAQQPNGLISNFRISNRARALAEHQATYATGLPPSADEYTTCLMSMNGTLQPTIRGFGLWTKNGRHILHDPQSGQGVEVWDDNSLKVLIGLLTNGKIGIKANDGEIYSGKFQTGNENSNTYIALNSNGTLSAYYNGKQTLDMWAGNWGNIVFCEDGNRVGQLYTTNEYDPVLGGTKRRFVVWGTGDGSLRLDGPGIELDSDNVNLARSSSSQISVRGKIWDDLLPAYDLGGFVGRDGSRWHTVRARYITSGDLCFEEESCPICEQPFTLGDTIVLTVHHIHEEHHTMCIPIHETCKDTRKALTVEVPETEKRYRLGKDGQIETYHATKFKEVEEQAHKIKDDYFLDEKTGEFKKKAVNQPAMKDEAVEIVTVKRRVPVMKTVKVELNSQVPPTTAT